MTNRLTAKEAKDIFLKSFFFSELWKIWLLMRRAKTRIPQPEDVEEFFRDFETRQLFHFLHLFIFGSYGCGGYYEAVINQFPQLKEKLAQTAFPFQISGKKDGIAPLMPKDFRLTHQTIGMISVTAHAWVRFCNRFQLFKKRDGRSTDLTPEFFAETLKRCFTQAREVELSDRGRIIRLIRHKNDSRYIPARYFYHPGADLRFVISCEEPPVMMTVEVPIIKDHKLISSDSRR